MNLKRYVIWTYLAVVLCALSSTIGAQRIPPVDPYSPENLGRLELTQYLDNLTYLKTNARRIAISRITNRAEAETRQAKVKKEILQLIGGLPARTPLNARIVGSVQGDGFKIEKVIFDSQPDFPVTALLYLPVGHTGIGSTRYPAIVVTPGHAPQGKASDYVFASNFARNGFAVLDYDPIGQGERIQYLNRSTGKSYLGRPTGEHGEAGLQPTLIGDAVTRYFVWDAMRAVDYLQSRPEIDPNRIGAFGCSGGGTITAMFSALDPRVKVAGVACFTTNYDTLLPAIGPQDGEQSIPGFINAGLDIPDWAELAAPRPYAIIATYQDMFPFAGAQQTENEVQYFYDLFGAHDHLKFLTGPGHHGHILPLFPDILRFFAQYLQPSGFPASPFVLMPPQGASPFAPPGNLPADAFQDTRTGQVMTSLPDSETVHSLTLKRATMLGLTKHKQISNPILLQQIVRSATKADVMPDLENTPAKSGYESAITQDLKTSDHDNTHFQEITFHIQQGLDLHGQVAWQKSPGKHPAVLLLTDTPFDQSASASSGQVTAMMQRLVNNGDVVLALIPRPSPPGTEETKSPLLGNFYLTELRAELNGKTILGMRIDDAIRGINYLAMRSDVDPKQITAYASYHLGLVLLHAAVLDKRLEHVTVDHTLVSYQSLLAAPMPIHACEDIVPGVIRHYDIPDLLKFLGHRATVKLPLSGNEDLSPATAASTFSETH